MNVFVISETQKLISVVYIIEIINVTKMHSNDLKICIGTEIFLIGNISRLNVINIVKKKSDMENIAVMLHTIIIRDIIIYLKNNWTI